MARFGLLNLSNGMWDGTPILSDTEYFNAMTSSSQNSNLAYGYLWWLNGKDSYKLPSSNLTFSGKLIPTAPDDMYAALGKNDQKIYVVPSLDLVVVRVGNKANEEVLALSGFDYELWEKIMSMICMETAVNEDFTKYSIEISPNLISDFFSIKTDTPYTKIRIIDTNGRLVKVFSRNDLYDISELEEALYFVEIFNDYEKIGVEKIIRH